MLAWFHTHFFPFYHASGTSMDNIFTFSLNQKLVSIGFHRLISVLTSSQIDTQAISSIDNLGERSHVKVCTWF